MLKHLELYFIIFLFYSFLGWTIEVFLKFIKYNRFVNRGFLIGPYLPIYGFGATFITFLLQKYSDDIIALFVFSMIICTILEYFTSFLMEKIFCARWWDYSNEKFNINGRVCLRNMIAFGILGILMMKYINPISYNFCMSCSEKTLNIICFIFFIMFIVDIMISTIILISVRRENKILDGDNTEKMSKKVYNRLRNLGWGYRRLLSAFPEVYHITKILDNSKKRAINYINKKRKKYIKKEQKLIEKSEERLEKIQDKYNEKIKKVRKKSNKTISKIENRNKK